MTVRPEVNLSTSPQTPGSDCATAPQVPGSGRATGSENPSTVLLYNGMTGLYICVGCCRLRLVVMLWGDFNQRMRVE